MAGFASYGAREIDEIFYCRSDFGALEGSGYGANPALRRTGDSTDYSAQDATDNSRTVIVDPEFWIRQGISIRINPALQPNRIAFGVSADGGIVIAVPVLVQQSLGVEVLAEEAQIVDQRSGNGRGISEGIEDAVPDDGFRAVGDLLRRAEMVGVDVVEDRRGSGLVYQRHGQGDVVSRRCLWLRSTKLVGLQVTGNEGA